MSATWSCKRWWSGEDSGTVAPLTAAAVAVIALVALVLASGAAILQLGSRARGAADLAALAAARVDRDSRALGWSASAALERGCDEALVVAQANGAELDRCARGAGSSVIVTVSVDLGAGRGVSRSTSRAGPAW